MGALVDAQRGPGAAFDCAQNLAGCGSDKAPVGETEAERAYR
jgi:hypothetical protein